MCSGVLHDRFIGESLLSPPVKEFWKSRVSCSFEIQGVLYCSFTFCRSSVHNYNRQKPISHRILKAYSNTSSSSSSSAITTSTAAVIWLCDL